VELITHMDETANVRVFTLSGDATDEDVLSVIAQTCRQPSIRLARNSLWDLRTANFSKFSAARVRQIASLVREEIRDGAAPKVAVVAGHDHTFGLARLLEAHVGSAVDLQVFRCPTEATSWLTAERGGESGPT
jgi:hypothetical protein